MPRSGITHTLASRASESAAQQQLTTGAGNTEQTLTLNRDCVAVVLSSRTGNAYVTFNDTAATSSNGIEIIAAAQPIYVPLGYHANPNHTLRVIGSAINTLLNVVQLA